MQRRLDLAASLVGQPKVLFLDEPTTGLDPRSRLGMWDIIRSLVAGGTTLLLTTQYLDEADELADEIVVIDHGLVIAAGTAEELKSRVGGDVLEFTVPDRTRIGDAVSRGREDRRRAEPHAGRRRPAWSAWASAAGARRRSSRRCAAWTAPRLETRGLALRRPSLDDVFMALTGHAAEETSQQGKRRGRRRGAGKDTAQDCRPMTRTVAERTREGSVMTAIAVPLAEPGLFTRARWAVSDTLTITRRNLLVWMRVPAYIVFTVIQPVIFVLMFRYVFGGAIPVRRYPADTSTS